jgi:glycosyltransferase involved in cell wall biosynthesis
MSTATPPITPTVSVIVATYNRSQVLRYAIESVRDSSWTDWELIIVGDACTDDTAECVASFADPRIVFVNLEGRCGDQSGPNNHGLRLARGRYVAFLNHDDIYLRDHLAACVAQLEHSAADLVWVPCALAHPNADAGDNAAPCRFTLAGVPPDQVFSPLAFCFASSWVLRRTLAERLGPWPKAERAFVTPSQDWLFRAWRSGATLHFVPTVSVVVVPSGFRPGSYARRESPDHAWLTQSLRDDPTFMVKMLQAAAVGEAKLHLFHKQAARPTRILWRLLVRPARVVLTALGIHPLALEHTLMQGGRGVGVRKHRARVGAD